MVQRVEDRAAQTAAQAAYSGPKMTEVAVLVLTKSFLGHGLAGQLVEPGERVLIDVPVDERGKPILGRNVRLLTVEEAVQTISSAHPEGVPEGAIQAGDLWLVPDGDGKFSVWDAKSGPAVAGDGVDPLLAAAAAAAGQAASPANQLAARTAQDGEDELASKDGPALRAFILENGGPPMPANAKVDALLAKAKEVRDAKAKPSA